MRSIKEKSKNCLDNNDGLVWFLCFNGISTLVGYSMPKPFYSKNSSGTI